MADPASCAIRIGVGAVVFRGDDVLLIRRAKPPFMGLWSIPGGALHHGETLAEAVLRELREETGVKARLGPLIGVFEALPGATDEAYDRHTVMIDYVADWTAGEPVAGDDAAEAEFVPFDLALERLSWDETRKALRSAFALRAAAANSL